MDCRSISLEYPTPEGALKLYGKEGVSMSIEEGSFLSVVGGSGWGKSTLVNLVLGLEKPTRGSMHFRGKDVTTSTFVARCARARIAAVFQRPIAVPHLSVIQNLQLALSMLGIPRRERDERIKEAVSFFGLENLTHSRPDSLSAGQKKRIDLARALAVRPEFLVLDEPTGDLDASIANLVMPLLRGMNRDHGTTILMTTAMPRHATKHQVHLKPPSFEKRPDRLVLENHNV
ncbi:MAG TPA: ATP-binding cassette domain-containing protein [Candidatus Dormibacteraeota bacterium]|jgi:putative ABC transport system ATP-binding protein|nr:ATP-binding cassette domain-containing protein [Candidatus Dormibacteraeota bacterium]